MCDHTWWVVDIILCDEKRHHFIELFNPRDDSVLHKWGAGATWEDEKKILNNIFQGLHVVLRVMNSKERIHVDEFEVE